MAKIRIDAQFSDPLEQHDWDELVPPPTFTPEDYAQVQRKYENAKVGLEKFISALERIAQDPLELGAKEILDVVNSAYQELLSVAGIVQQLEEV